MKFTVVKYFFDFLGRKTPKKISSKLKKTEFVLSQKNNDDSKRYKKNWSIVKQSVLKSAAESSVTELTTYSRTWWPAARPVAFPGRFGWVGRLKFWRLINWRGAARSSFRAAPFKKTCSRTVVAPPLFTIEKWAKKGENIVFHFSKWCRKTWGKFLVFCYIRVNKLHWHFDLKSWYVA